MISTTCGRIGASDETSEAVVDWDYPLKTMELKNIRYKTIDWSGIPAEPHTGVTGDSTWKIFQEGNVRVRVVKYSAGYFADHWCQKGHVVHVLEGSFVSELKDGRNFELSEGMSYVVADGHEEHRSRSEHGVTLLIVD